MIRDAIIIDDEHDAIDHLTILLNDFCDQINVLAHFENPINAVKWLTKNVKYPKPVVFIDINMPEINGFTFLELINSSDYDIIFVTADAKYAIKAIDYRPFAYLLKPIDIDKLIEICSKLTNDSNQQVPSSKIKIPTQEGYRFISVADVIFLKAERSYCKILIEPNIEILISQSLGKLMSTIQHPHLFRCHKSFTINLSKITSYAHASGGIVLLNEKQEIPVSKTLRQTLFNALKSSNL